MRRKGYERLGRKSPGYGEAGAGSQVARRRERVG